MYFGGVGLNHANKDNDKTGKKLNLAALIIGTVVFFINVLLFFSDFKKV